MLESESKSGMSQQAINATIEMYKRSTLSELRAELDSQYTLYDKSHKKAYEGATTSERRQGLTMLEITSDNIIMIKEAIQAKERNEMTAIPAYDNTSQSMISKVTAATTYGNDNKFMYLFGGLALAVCGWMALGKKKRKK